MRALSLDFSIATYMYIHCLFLCLSTRTLLEKKPEGQLRYTYYDVADPKLYIEVGLTRALVLLLLRSRLLFPFCFIYIRRYSACIRLLYPRDFQLSLKITSIYGFVKSLRIYIKEKIPMTRRVC